MASREKEYLSEIKYLRKRLQSLREELNYTYSIIERKNTDSLTDFEKMILLLRKSEFTKYEVQTTDDGNQGIIYLTSENGDINFTFTKEGEIF